MLKKDPQIREGCKNFKTEIEKNSCIKDGIHCAQDMLILGIRKSATT